MARLDIPVVLETPIDDLRADVDNIEAARGLLDANSGDAP